MLGIPAVFTLLTSSAWRTRVPNLYRYIFIVVMIIVVDLVEVAFREDSIDSHFVSSHYLI